MEIKLTKEQVNQIQVLEYAKLSEVNRKLTKELNELKYKNERLQEHVDEIEAKYVYAKVHGAEVSQKEADLIEEAKNMTRHPLFWLYDQVDTHDEYLRLVKGYINSYTIKDKKYRVELSHNFDGTVTFLTKFMHMNGIQHQNTRSIKPEFVAGNERYTEAEINGIDPRYMAFAVEVEE